MRPTRPSVLVVLAVVGGGAGYLLALWRYSSLPPLPVYPPAAVLLLAVAESYLAYGTRARLLGRPGTQPIMPIVVARTAALAKASSLVGAGLAGGSLGLLAYLLPRGYRVPAGDLGVAAFAAVASLALTGAALGLERVCRAPPPGAAPPPDPPDPGRPVG